MAVQQKSKKGLIIFILCCSLLFIIYMGISSIQDGTFNIFIESIIKTFGQYFLIALLFAVVSSIIALYKHKKAIKLNYKLMCLIMSIFLILSIATNIYQYKKLNEITNTFNKYRATMEGNYSGWSLEEIQKLFNNEL